MKKYKIIKVGLDFKYEKTENLMNEMAEKGWEVVCLTAEPSNNFKLIITFCRDDSNDKKMM